METMPPAEKPAIERVKGPAIGLIVTAIIGIVLAAIAIVLNVLGVGLTAAGDAAGSDQAIGIYAEGGVGIIQSVVGIIVGIVVLLGANKMKNLENYNFAMAAAILAMIPCVSPCCVLGLPFGIWALVVITKPEVKSAFAS